jgi:hypothetical protein
MTAGLNRSPAARGTVSSFILHVLVGKQHVGKSEPRKITHPHGVQDSVKVITLVLNDPRVEAMNGALDRRATLVET